MVGAVSLSPIADDTHHFAGAPGAVQDPVCGMSVDPPTAKHRAEYAGHSYFFCSSRCRERFTAEPARYLAPAEVSPPTPAGAGLWT